MEIGKCMLSRPKDLKPSLKSRQKAGQYSIKPKPSSCRGSSKCFAVEEFLRQMRLTPMKNGLNQAIPLYGRPEYLEVFATLLAEIGHSSDYRPSSCFTAAKRPTFKFRASYTIPDLRSHKRCRSDGRRSGELESVGRRVGSNWLERMKG